MCFLLLFYYLVHLFKPTTGKGQWRQMEYLFLSFSFQ